MKEKEWVIVFDDKVERVSEWMYKDIFPDGFKEKTYVKVVKTGSEVISMWVFYIYMGSTQVFWLIEKYVFLVLFIFSHKTDLFLSFGIDVKFKLICFREQATCPKRMKISFSVAYSSYIVHQSLLIL